MWCGRNDLRILRKELETYQVGLSDRCGLVVANKADLPEARANILRLREEATGLKVVAASAKLGDNLSNVVKEMLRIREESSALHTKDLDGR